MPKISQTTIEEMPVRLPDREQQDRIVARVTTYLDRLKQAEDDIAAASSLADQLRRAVLHHAFTGQLVPQNPSDEPAGVLLERIKAERAEREEQAKAERKQAKAAKGNGSPKHKRSSRRSATEAAG